LLGWSQEELETASRVSKKTIADFERDQRNQQARTIDAIRLASYSSHRTAVAKKYEKGVQRPACFGATMQSIANG
jgi:transcriptional regulator with XRE-family HTH domain